MKKYVSILLICTFICCLFSGCSFTSLEPDEAEIKNICDLATLECRYHTVAESTKAPEKGVTHFLDQEAKCWIEYDAVVTMGIDASQLSMEIEENTVTVNIPNAKVLHVTVDSNSYTNADPITSKSSWYNRNHITSEDISEAIKNSNEKIEATAMKDSKTLQTAYNQAKEIIANYINMIGASTNTEYQIVWKTV